MARIASGVDLETTLTVVDAAEREYRFTFDLPPDGAGFRLEVGGVAIAPSRYELTVADPPASGGVVRLLSDTEIAVPVQLMVADTVRMYRDTTIERVVAEGGQGYARASALSALASWTRRVAEELVGRPQAQAAPSMPGQPAEVPDATTEVKGKIEIADEGEADAGTDETRAMTPALVERLLTPLRRAATISERGRIELATGTEADTGTDATKAMTPSLVKRVVKGFAFKGSSERVPASQIPAASASLGAGEHGGLSSADYTALRAGGAAATESAAGTVRLATEAEATAGTSTTRVGTIKRIMDMIVARTPNASETVRGLTDFASETEARTGTDNTKAVTPLRLQQGLNRTGITGLDGDTRLGDARTITELEVKGAGVEASRVGNRLIIEISGNPTAAPTQRADVFTSALGALLTPFENTQLSMTEAVSGLDRVEITYSRAGRVVGTPLVARLSDAPLLTGGPAVASTRSDVYALTTRGDFFRLTLEENEAGMVTVRPTALLAFTEPAAQLLALQGLGGKLYGLEPVANAAPILHEVNLPATDADRPSLTEVGALTGLPTSAFTTRVRFSNLAAEGRLPRDNLLWFGQDAKVYEVNPLTAAATEKVSTTGFVLDSVIRATIAKENELYTPNGNYVLQKIDLTTGVHSAVGRQDRQYRRIFDFFDYSDDAFMAIDPANLNIFEWTYAAGTPTQHNLAIGAGLGSRSLIGMARVYDLSVTSGLVVPIVADYDMHLTRGTGQTLNVMLDTDQPDEIRITRIQKVS